MALNKR